MRYVALIAVLAFAAACYSASNVSYSNPQTTGNQWLIEFRTDESKVMLTMQYRRERENGKFSHSSTGFGIALDQLSGLSRDQMLSAAGNVVRFQLKRDAGTFSFEGWFKEGNGSGHFTFTPNSSFAAELGRLGFGKSDDEQLQALAMSDVGMAYLNELKAQGYDTTTVDQLRFGMSSGLLGMIRRPATLHVKALLKGEGDWRQHD